MFDRKPIDDAPWLSRTMDAIASLNPPAAKAAEAPAEESTAIALKAQSFDDAKGIIIAKASKAGNFDRENERIPLRVLEEATYELVRNIGHDKVGVDFNHEPTAIKCDILQAWIGEPMPDPLATYVALRPHDRADYEAVKAHGVGMSWSGPYHKKVVRE
jgi:hypothetical protein